MLNPSDMKTASAETARRQNFFRAVRHRWKIVLLVFLLVLTATVVYLFLQPQIFQATATIAVNSSTDNDGNRQSAVDAMVYLQSRALADQVVQRLNLGWQVSEYSPKLNVTIGQFVVSGSLPGLHIKLTDPNHFSIYDLSGRFIAEGESGKLLEAGGVSLLLHIQSGQAGQTMVVERQPLESHVDQLLSGLQVTPLQEDSNILRIMMRGEDPEFIRDAVNILIEIYQAKITQESTQAIEQIDRQLADIQSKLDAAEQDLRDYRQQSGLSELPPQGERLVAKVTQLEQRKTGLEWQASQLAVAAERLQQAIESQIIFVAPRLEGFPQINEAATRLASLETQKRALLIDYTESHPEVEGVAEEILAAQRVLLSLYLSASRELALEDQRLAANIAAFEVQLNDAPEAELARRTRERKSQSDSYSFLQDKQREIRAAQLAAVNEVKVIDPAITPKSPIKPDKAKILAVGGLAGLLLGLCSAFFLSIIDPTFRTVDEVRSKLNLPIYGVIPMIPFEHESACPVAVLEPKAPVVEAFRALRTRLHYVTGKQKHKTIMVTSSLPGEGKSTLSANLAVVLSMTGSKVLLIGCDLRRPTLHKVFREDNVPGLVELLRDQNQAAIRHLQQPRIDFLPAGTVPQNPSEILDSKRMQRFLEIARERYDYVVIDAPPVLPVTDAQILAPLADINLVVLEPCRVPEKAARQMVKSLQDVGVTISGIVINDKTGQGFKYYGSYSYYGNRNFAGYYGESLDELQDGVLESAVKKAWRKLNS